MTTNYLSTLKTNRFLILFVGSIALYSCGSYQNSSYYDNDGVYGVDTSTRTTYQKDHSNTTKYASQFQTMREEYATEETFTDVSNYVTPIDSSKTKSQSYAGWGNNQSNIVVNIYDNWGWNGWYGNAWGWGWNNWSWNGWYGNPWGWNGWNNWGWNSWYGNPWGWNGWYGNPWGWNSWFGNPWGWNNWYGGGPRVAFNNGRRGSVNGFVNGTNYSNGRYSNRNGVRANAVGVDQSRRGNTTSETSIFNQPRISKSEPRTISQPRNSEGTQPRSIPSTPRPRSQETQPRINNQPRNDSYPSTPRNSDFGGGRSSGFGTGGGFGGGRSSGGGRRG